MVMSPLLIGPLAGVVALWSILLPRALGHQLPRQLDCWQFVGLAVSILQALVMVYSQFTPSAPWRGAAHYVFLYLMGASVAVAIHVVCSHDRVLPCCRPS
jgi:hypothetical protein